MVEQNFFPQVNIITGELPEHLNETDIKAGLQLSKERGEPVRLSGLSFLTLIASQGIKPRDNEAVVRIQIK
jgi:hypothetical protein